MSTVRAVRAPAPGFADSEFAISITPVNEQVPENKLLLVLAKKGVLH